MGLLVARSTISGMREASKGGMSKCEILTPFYFAVLDYYILLVGIENLSTKEVVPDTNLGNCYENKILESVFNSAFNDLFSSLILIM